MGAFARHLTDLGHEVRVLAEKPNHPAGVFFEGFEKGTFIEGAYDGIPVTHCWVWTRPEKGFAGRLLFYLSFMISAVFGAWRLEGKYDAVLATSPPLTVGPAGWLISRLKRACFVLDVRDLWPDVAVAMGELEDGWLARLARRLERFLYSRADGIAAVTDGFCRDIRQRADGDPPVIRVSNGTEPEIFQVLESKKQLRADLGLPDSFLVTYAGNLGLAQGLPHLLDVAELLEEGDDVTILLLGDGPLKDMLAREAEQRDLENLQIRDRVPLDEAARYMAASDALLVPLGKRPIFRKFIPSKLFDAMAAGCPVLLSVDGEAREILEEAGAGLYYPAEDAEALVEGIRRLRSDPRRKEMGRRGRQFVTRHFSREEQARKLADFLEQIVDGSPPPAGHTIEHRGETA